MTTLQEIQTAADRLSPKDRAELRTWFLEQYAEAWDEAEGPEEGRGERLVRSLRGQATLAMTTDEIMALTRGDA